MRNIILFLTMLIILSCVPNRDIFADECLTSDYEDVQYLPLKLPNWFLNMPQEENLAIGIAATNPYNPEFTDSTIKETASVICSRNKSAIVIAKLKMKDNQKVMTPTLSEFKLQLASNISELKEYYKNSRIINRSEACGMTIGLVGEKSVELNLTESIIISDKPPVWYKENTYYTKDNYLISSGKSSSINMATAYSNAYNTAVYNLIAGVKPKVQAEIINSHNYTEKFVEIDASLIIENMKNSRNYLVLRKSGNGFVYDGYVEIKWQPQYKVKQINVKEQ